MQVKGKSKTKLCCGYVGDRKLKFIRKNDNKQNTRDL